MKYRRDSWSWVRFAEADRTEVTTREVKNWRFLQGLDCSAESIRASKKEIRDALKKGGSGEVKSVPGVIVNFGERTIDAYLQYNLMKEEFHLGALGGDEGIVGEDQFCNLGECMKHFLEIVQEDQSIEYDLEF